MNVTFVHPPSRDLDEKSIQFIKEKAALRSSEISELERRNVEMLEKLKLLEAESTTRKAQSELYKAGAEALDRIERLENLAKTTSVSVIELTEKLNSLIQDKLIQISLLKKRQDDLVKEVTSLQKDVEDFRKMDDQQSKVFESLSPEDKIASIRKDGIPLHRSIKTYRIPIINLQKELPVRNPINETLEQHTKGQMGKITCWFNPALLQWKGKRYMTYRCECHPFWRHGRIGICESDENWNPIPDTCRWSLFPGRQGFAESEDGRWIVHKGAVQMAYNTGFRQRMAYLNEDFTLNRACEYTSDDILFNDREKNWAFFSHEDKLYCLYMQSPHVICDVDEDNCRISRFHEEPWKLPWHYGTPRGGATPVLHNGFYYHFFHSSGSIDGKWDDCGWGIRRRYYVGVALFESKPPFKLVTASRYPLFNGVPDPDQSKLGIYMPSDHAVVFPASAHRTFTNNGWLLAVGVNDQHCYTYEIPDFIIDQRLA